MATGGQVAVTKCDICAENIGTLFCYACSNYLCQVCELYHQKFPATRQHMVVNSQDIDKLVANNKHICERHEQNYSLFCSTCDSLICTICATAEHHSHNFKAFSNVVIEARAWVAGNILYLEEKRKDIFTLIEDIKLNKLKKMEDNLDIYSQQVQDTSKECSKIVESVTETDIARVTDHFKLKRKQAEETLSELERLCNESSTLSEKCEQILTVEHDVTFILSQQILAKELTKVDYIPKVDQHQSTEKFSQRNFAESLIENIETKYKLKGKEKLESKVSALEHEITILKNKCETERKAKENMQTVKEKDIMQLQQQNRELRSQNWLLQRRLNRFGFS